MGEYLTKEGKLKESVRVKIGGVQFLAPPDEVWTISPTGDWAWENSDSKGNLSSVQLAALAQHLTNRAERKACTRCGGRVDNEVRVTRVARVMRVE